MEAQELYCAKLQTLNDRDIYLKYSCCILGSEKRSVLRDLDITRKNPNSINIKIEKKDIWDKGLLKEIEDLEISHKAVITTCKEVRPMHAVFKYNPDSDGFEIKAVDPLFLNDEFISREQGYVKLNHFDKVHFECFHCISPHLYYFISATSDKGDPDSPTGGTQLAHKPSSSEKQYYNPQSQVQANYAMHVNKMPDKGLSAKWNNIEKDQLKKLILTFGYGRWAKIKKYSKVSGQFLISKQDVEMKAFANAFLRTIIEYLGFEKNELKKFLINLIEERPEDPLVHTKAKDWSDLIKQRAAAWGKRLQLLQRVRNLIEKFKHEREKYKQLISNGEVNEENEKMSKIYCILPTPHRIASWDNLLNFLPNSVFYGQRPSVWWTRKHDIDLLRGTYKYGYANYQAMRNDTIYRFHKLEKGILIEIKLVEGSFQEFPNADTITRRLKKLVQIIGRNDKSFGKILFEEKDHFNEPTGFTLNEKVKILTLIIDFGVPLSSEGKNDWNLLKEKLEKDLEGDKSVQTIERFVQRLRMVSQQILGDSEQQDEEKQEDDEENDEEILPDEDKATEENKNMVFDPDKDGFEFSYKQARKLYKHMNLLHYIRKYILANNAKLFNSGLSSLEEEMQKEEQSLILPEGWKCETHDKGLLFAVADNGFRFLQNLSNVATYGFESIKVDYEVAKKRGEYLCQFFREFSISSKGKKRKPGDPNMDMAPKKKASKLIVNKDEGGNIIYPIFINSSLSIVDLGTIEYERPLFHSEKNLFPIGYKSLREHSSMVKPGERAIYTCEILDGGTKPQYKVTCAEDPDNPILRDSSTGCWIVICNKINEMQANRRSQVTISGPERFGLSDPNVIRLMQSLPDADKCNRYVFR